MGLGLRGVSQNRGILWTPKEKWAFCMESDDVGFRMYGLGPLGVEVPGLGSRIWGAIRL